MRKIVSFDSSNREGVTMPIGQIWIIHQRSQTVFPDNETRLALPRTSMSDLRLYRKMHEAKFCRPFCSQPQYSVIFICNSVPIIIHWTANGSVPNFNLKGRKFADILTTWLVRYVGMEVNCFTLNLMHRLQGFILLTCLPPLHDFSSRRFWIWLVTFESAGPACGGLVIKPPSWRRIMWTV